MHKKTSAPNQFLADAFATGGFIAVEEKTPTLLRSNEQTSCRGKNVRDANA